MEERNDTLRRRWAARHAASKEKGTWKSFNHLEGPMDAWVPMENRGDVLILSSNNYLGLSSHPQVMAAGKAALERYGAGTASVRFICGTYSLHRELEQELAGFCSTQAALTYVSCWTANTGSLPLLAEPGDVILTDELNHASLIDGIRLSKAARKIYRHSDLEDLEQKLKEASKEKDSQGVLFVVTDGVFSMEGDLARLPEILSLVRRYDAVLLVDDSHGTGVLGKTGRGVVEHFGLEGEVDIITGTLGKALGGAAGGYVAASREVIDALSQASRPQIFSNALPATVAGSALAAVRLLGKDDSLLLRLRKNTRLLREGLISLGYKPMEGESAIIPLIVGQTSLAIEMSRLLLDRGVFVTGFGHPVVPEGAARVRIQASAVLEEKDIDKALEAFAHVGRELSLL